MFQGIICGKHGSTVAKHGSCLQCLLETAANPPPRDPVDLDLALRDLATPERGAAKSGVELAAGDDPTYYGRDAEVAAADAAETALERRILELSTAKVYLVECMVSAIATLRRTRDAALLQWARRATSKDPAAATDEEPAFSLLSEGALSAIRILLGESREPAEPMPPSTEANSWSDTRAVVSGLVDEVDPSEDSPVEEHRGLDVDERQDRDWVLLRKSHENGKWWAANERDAQLTHGHASAAECVAAAMRKPPREPRKHG